MTIQKRRIGSLEVSALGLGCMGMSTVYGKVDPVEARATINHALDVGVNLLDTADMYGAGHNEQFVGAAIKGRRDEVVLATKFGIKSLPKIGLPYGVGASAERARKCIDASLQRLGVDHIDLYYLHRPDPKTPIEESVAAMGDMVRAGKVRQLGLSEVTADQLRRAHAVHPIAAVQSEWSVFSRGLEKDVVPAALERGVALVPYSPLGRGMLTGSPSATSGLAFLDYRRMLPRWRKANLAHNIALVEEISALAKQVGCTPGQLALAWLLGKNDHVVPIPGTKRRKYLDENLGALNVVVPQEIRAQLDELQAAGDRYGTVSSSLIAE